MPAPWQHRALTPIISLFVVVAAGLPALASAGTASGSGASASVGPLVERRLEARGSVDVLVTLDGTAALARARASAAGDSRSLLRLTVPAYRSLKAGLLGRVDGVQVLRDYSALPILFVRVDSKAALERLARDPAVAGVGADRRDRTMLGESLPLINQPAVAAQGHEGSGTAVAVLDTGLDYTRPAFGACAGGPGSPGCRVVVAMDFAPNDGLLDDPAAGFHGTNVSGIVAGVAPETGILGLDVFNGLTSSTSDQISAINFAIANQAVYNVVAINVSLGAVNSYNTAPCASAVDARVAAFANARAAGILPVVAAGNNAFSSGGFHVGISRPACIPGALPVGAVYDANVGGRAWGNPPNQCGDSTTAADKITCFSQAWANPMQLAPGALITAAGVLQGGTSQATPHVAGAVAVLRDAVPGSSVTAVEAALLNSGPLVFDTLVNQSFHRLDLVAAMMALGPPQPGAPTITSFTPGKGKVGATVILTGTGFTGATAVTFNGTAATTFSVDLDTQITVTVPSGAGTGPLTVTNPSGTGTSATSFVVKHARSVSLHFSNARGNVSVVDGFNDCRANVSVKLQHLENGRWRTVATGVTTAAGAYNLGSQTDPGKYRTMAKKFTTATGDVCLKDLSPVDTL